MSEYQQVRAQGFQSSLSIQPLDVLPPSLPQRTFAVKLFKVLVPSKTYMGQKVLTGGHTQFDWTPYLPTKTGPGKMATYTGTLALCATGYHVTKTPYSWGADKSRNRVFEVNVFGKVVSDSSDKICCEAVQLVREIKQERKPVKKVTKKKKATKKSKKR